MALEGAALGSVPIGFQPWVAPCRLAALQAELPVAPIHTLGKLK